MKTALWSLALLLTAVNAPAQDDLDWSGKTGRKFLWGKQPARGPVKNPKLGTRESVIPADAADYDGFFGKMPGGLPIQGKVPKADTTYTGDGFTARLKEGPRKQAPKQEGGAGAGQVSDESFKHDMREALMQLPSAYDTGHLTPGSAALHLMPMLDPVRDAKELEMLRDIEKADNWGEKPKGYPTSARDYLISRLHDYRELQAAKQGGRPEPGSGETAESGD